MIVIANKFFLFANINANEAPLYKYVTKKLN